MNTVIDSFGDYLKELISESGKSNQEFYMELNITKPYFYDIVAGRIKPPPYSVQVKAMEVLRVEQKKRMILYDLAAKMRGEIPGDIAEYIRSNPEACDKIRKWIK